MRPWTKTPPDAAALSSCQPAWVSNHSGRCLWEARQGLVHVPARLQGVGLGVAKQGAGGGAVKLWAQALHASHLVNGWGYRAAAAPPPVPSPAAVQ